jgi:hypothetical protein
VVLKPVALALALAFTSAARAQDSYAPLNFSSQVAPPAASQVAPPAASQVAPPATSQVAPPLPFRYVGRLVQNGRSEALVMRGSMLYSIAEGDEIDGEYRVERISGATIHFTYLPGRVKQNLDLTAASR